VTPRQRAFVAAYLANGGNGAQAARDAGYSRRVADRQASRLLGYAEVREAIAAAQAARAERLGLTADEWEGRLVAIARADIRRIARWQGTTVGLLSSEEIPDDIAACIVAVEQTATGVRVKLADKLKALEILGRRHGWTEPAGGTEVRIVVEHVDERIASLDGSEPADGSLPVIPRPTADGVGDFGEAP
jgi:phage terminase small subunit